jgi:hypothetical protein
MQPTELFDGGQVVDVLFEGLVVLPLDLQLGLQFLYQQLESRYFRLELHDIRGHGLSTKTGGSSRRLCLGGKRFG